jgi:hypothetical protein
LLIICLLSRARRQLRAFCVFASSYAAILSPNTQCPPFTKRRLRHLLSTQSCLDIHPSPDFSRLFSPFWSHFADKYSKILPDAISWYRALKSPSSTSFAYISMHDSRLNLPVHTILNARCIACIACSYTYAEFAYCRQA